MRRRFSPHLASSDPSLTVDRLRAFVSQGVVNQVHLVGVDNGFALLVHLRTGPLWLHTEKSQQRRVFSRVETALRLLADAGVKYVDRVDLTGWKED
jgi:hypothetical protein